MEIINRSKKVILVSLRSRLQILHPNPKEIKNFPFNEAEIYKDSKYNFNLYLKLEEDLILVKKVTEFCNKIIIKDSLIENEVEVSCE